MKVSIFRAVNPNGKKGFVGTNLTDEQLTHGVPNKEGMEHLAESGYSVGIGMDMDGDGFHVMGENNEILGVVFFHKLAEKYTWTPLGEEANRLVYHSEDHVELLSKMVKEISELRSDKMKSSSEWTNDGRFAKTLEGFYQTALHAKVTEETEGA